MKNNLTGAINGALAPISVLQPQPQYEYYAPLLHSGVQYINTAMFDSVETVNKHFYMILYILQDGVETQQVQKSVLWVTFTDGETVKLSIFDYWYNLIFWSLPTTTGHPITSNYLWFNLDITQDAISDYINEKFLEIDRDNYTNLQLNNIMDDCMFKFQFIDKFSLYLYNTANNEDTIELMRENKDFYNAIHCDLSKIDIADVKDEGMRYTKEGIKAIINSKKHWAEPYLRSHEGINTKQLREFMFNIGTVPNDEGGVYPRPINGNFSLRGITNPIDYLIEASKARKAQILGHQNVSLSGAFARILGLNNLDDFLNPDKNYICDSKHFIEFTITNITQLNMFKNRYYRFSPDGVERKISQTPYKHNLNLIGKTIYLRSPITCASRTRGKGICRRCYGDLALTNYDVNIGQMAAELLSSMLTQRLLSAKHLLESNVKKIVWNDAFSQFFEISMDYIKLKDDLDFKKIKIVIREDDITEDDSDEEKESTTYVNQLIVRFKNTDYVVKSNDDDSLFFTDSMEKIISRKSTDDNDCYIIDADDVKTSPLFYIQVSNNALGETLNGIKNILNRKGDVQRLKTKDTMTEALVNTVIDGHLTIDAVHLEILLAHQCVSADSVLLDPQWQYENEQYKMVTLDDRLKNNPSATVSLMYKDIKRLLSNPDMFKKTKASVVDLFFMTQPQNYMASKPEVSNLIDEKVEEEITEPVTLIETNTGYLDTFDDAAEE